MNRREALAAVSALLGGAVIGSEAFLAGCTPSNETEGVLRVADVKLLDEVGETILPATDDAPGAKAAGIGAFMNVMVTDCYSPEEQQVFRDGLDALETAARKEYGRAFRALNEEERHAFLLSLEEEAAAHRAARRPDDPPVHYYSMIKQLTVMGYFTSEVGATQALRYVAVPGRYEGCIPYTEGEKAWA